MLRRVKRVRPKQWTSREHAYRVVSRLVEIRVLKSFKCMSVYPMGGASGLVVIVLRAGYSGRIIQHLLHLDVLPAALLDLAGVCPAVGALSNVQWDANDAGSECVAHACGEDEVG